MNADTRMQKAKSKLIIKSAFFGRLTMKLKFVNSESEEAKNIPNAPLDLWAMATNGDVLIYNPKFVDESTDAELIGCIAHEDMHPALCHHTRIGDDRNKEYWNMAGDIVINNILIDANFILPKDALTNRNMRNLSTEQIYKKIYTDKGGSGNKNGISPSPDGKWNIGQVFASGAKNETEKQKEEADWKISIAQAQKLSEAQQAGDISANMKRLINEVLQPKVPWEVLMEDFVERMASDHHTWSPPNRRVLQQGIYLPSLKSDSLPTIGFATDTSGSISQHQLDQQACEMTNLLQTYQTDLIAIFCDSQITHVEQFTTQDLPIKLKLYGGGGTDLRPPFKYIKENNIDISCMIYMTDLICNKFPDTPEYPTLWINTSPYHNNSYVSKPPFGEVIEIN